MANSKVSNLTAASALDGTELYYGVQSSSDVKVTGDQIRTLVWTAPVDSSLNITAGAALDATSNGKDVVSTASDGGATSGGGGGVILQAGNAPASGEGGVIVLTAGYGGAITGNGGAVNITGGSAQADGSNGGTIAIAAGNGAQVGGGPGGALVFTAGAGRSAGGDGGDITFTPGTAVSGTAGHIILSNIEDFADDAAAATGGVPVNGLYRTASAVKIRVA